MSAIFKPRVELERLVAKKCTANERKCTALIQSARFLQNSKIKKIHDNVPLRFGLEILEGEVQPKHLVQHEINAHFCNIEGC